jgi:hypothetical protein
MGQQQHEQVTAFIPNWRRPGNIGRIVAALRQQTVQPRIVLVDNSSEAGGEMADDVWRAPFNVGPFYKFLVAKHYDGWLYFNDDDVVPTEDEYIERLIAVAQGGGWRIVGPRARTVSPEPPYYAGLPDTAGPTNNVKMGSAVMHRGWLGQVRVPPADWLLRNDDIWVSLEVSQGEPVLYGAAELVHCLRDLPQRDCALSRQKEHWDERSEGVRQWYTM